MGNIGAIIVHFSLSLAGIRLKMTIAAPPSPISAPSFPLANPVIPAKAGIQRGRGACEPGHLPEIKYK